MKKEDACINKNIPVSENLTLELNTFNIH